MADQLGLYNKALIHLEERQLVSLTESREARRVLDRVYPDAVAYCLGQGLWRFAKRAVQVDPSSTVAPSFGWNSAFTIPADWVRTVIVSAVPELDPPLEGYTEEAGYWYANCNPLFVSYVSNDPLYGMNLGAWPWSFTEYVGYRMARVACMRLPGKKDLKDDLIQEETKAKRNAKGNDAMNDPPGRPPTPYLVRARRGGFGPGGLFGR